MDTPTHHQPEKADTAHLSLYRLLWFIAIFTTPLTGFFDSYFNPKGNPALLGRFIMFLIFLLFFLASYLLAFVKKHIQYFFYLSLYLDITLTAYIAGINHFDTNTALFLILVNVGTSLCFNTIRSLVLYEVYFLFISAAFLFFDSTTTIFKIPYFSYLVIISVIFYVVLKLRLDIQEQLLTSQTALQTIFDESPDALCIADAQTYLNLQVNKASVRLFETQDINELLTTSLLAFSKDRISDDDKQIMQTTIKEKGIWMKEVLFQSKKDREFWGEVVMSPIVLKGKEVILTRITDISLRKKSDSEIQKNQEELEKINKTMVDRELRMVELKNENQKLLEQLNSKSSS